MTTATTDRRLTLPRSVGTWRPVTNIRPGWWVHCEPLEADTVAGEWAKVRAVITGTIRNGGPDHGRRVVELVFTKALSDDDGNAITVLASSEAVTLTEREATRLGLVAEEVTP